MTSSLFALIDDIATILDNLALNAQQVAGLVADRELPLVWAVCKGSLVNKLILVPAAFGCMACRFSTMR